MMNRVTRMLRHLWFDEHDVRRAIGADALERLEQRIKDSERRHSGEIRLCVEGGLPLSYLRRGATPRERAIAMFGKLRVWDTENNNGVLIYVLLAEHSIEVVADRGLHRHVPRAHWQSMVGGMSGSFKAGQFEQGLNDAIDAVDNLLVKHFPLGEGEANPNELPDTAYLG
jgi:uncharacterized membrane protein